MNCIHDQSYCGSQKVGKASKCVILFDSVEK